MIKPALAATAVVMALSASAPAQADACVLTPLSPCGIVGSKIVVVKAIADSRPCTPGVPVNEGVNCTFDTSVWALQTAQNGVATAQQIFNNEYAQVEQTTKDVLVVVDATEKAAMAQACYTMGIPPEECPQI